MRLDLERTNEFLRTVVKVPLGRLTAAVGMRRRRVSARPVGRGGRICWRDLDLIEGDEEKVQRKEVEKAVLCMPGVG